MKNDAFWKKDKNDYYYIIDRPCMKKCLKELAHLNPRHNLELLKEKISFESMHLKELVKDLDFLQKVDERQKALEESKNI